VSLRAGVSCALTAMVTVASRVSTIAFIRVGIINGERITVPVADRVFVVFESFAICMSSAGWSCGLFFLFRRFSLNAQIFAKLLMAQGMQKGDCHNAILDTA
jgi:hypothetical protein